MKKVLLGLLIACFLFIIVFFTCIPAGKQIIINWQYSLEKVDESNYTNKKEVEDTCRAMISSYNSDKLTYNQYKNYDINSEQKGWSDAAKIRANQTASTYNNYVLKNNYVWKNNIPSDIYLNLPYLE